jgi:hypothetical protein
MACRFVIDVQNKDVYVWDYRLLHTHVAKALNFEYPCNDGSFMYGKAEGMHDGKMRDVFFWDIYGRKAKNKLKTLGWARPWFVDLDRSIMNVYKIKLDV